MLSGYTIAPFRNTTKIETILLFYIVRSIMKIRCLVCVCVFLTIAQVLRYEIGCIVYWMHCCVQNALCSRLDYSQFELKTVNHPVLCDK